MAKFTRFEEIEAWQKSRALTRSVYEVSRRDPFAKDFALKDQIRRAAISVMSNIAEGFERDGNAEFLHFLSIAKASCGELRSQLYTALDLGYVDEVEFHQLSNESQQVSRLVSGLIKYLKQSNYRGTKFQNGAKRLSAGNQTLGVERRPGVEPGT